MVGLNVDMLALAMLALLLGASAATKPVSQSLDALPQRPVIKVGPYTTGKRFPPSPARDPAKVCRVTGGGQVGKDDSVAIFEALHKCNDGGTVVLGGKLTVARALDLTFLKHIDVAITGTIMFTDDIDYWVANSFKYPFQDSSTFWRWGGEDVNIFGNGVGVIDGNGQAWYNRFSTDKTVLRPILFLSDGLHSAQISGLRMLNSPNWFNLYQDTSDLIISDMLLEAKSTNATVETKNTDGFDTLRSSNIIIQNSIIRNTDDCVSFKPNTSSVVVQNLDCTGSHGISVGSLGQYFGEVDIVEDLYIYNTSMANASDGARLKVWPGRPTGSTATNAGGGIGYVRNITYDTFRVQNDDNAITVDQCYGQKNLTLCQKYPSTIVMSDVLFKNFKGTTSKRYDPRVGTLFCSAPQVCLNFRAEDIDVQNPSGKNPVWHCEGFDTSKLAFACKPAS